MKYLLGLLLLIILEKSPYNRDFTSDFKENNYE